ncbi:HD-GYP domain protein [Oleiphilus messinensis]|uniref:HD-GYP domain protein n=1 Tax=Oleiphilus messinensis TaxID=141451 RepID=A0A1Y0IEN7_9GAMM|nr:HD family phosphohydrolase [Oleiphilus messinensis]ARU58629.1 HD-GYP domain protein [Oleiphilus messinensis]
MDSKVYDTLIRIGQKLFAENDLYNLCEMIIDEAQAITCAEGGTLYLVDQQPPQQLTFCIVHNKKLHQYETHFGSRSAGLKPIPLKTSDGQPNVTHIAASAANRREIINIEDTYQNTQFDFSGAHTFDEEAQYHTQSVLAVPLVNDVSELVGVLQLINAREPDSLAVVPFSREQEPVIATLASFAALAINAQNLANTNKDLLIKLSCQSNTQLLMESILDEAQKLTQADGGSLYLLNDSGDVPVLEFIVVRNATLGLNYGGATGQAIPFQPIALYELRNGKRYPNANNVVTSCVHLRREVVIDDAYREEGYDFSGTRHFDEQTGYRSKSFLTLPLIDHNKEVIGVLQLVNARDPFSQSVVPFSKRVVPLVKALATYAAIALDNQLLVHELKDLLDNFIQCIAKAIDAKSPHTSGHCQRVPLLTELLAQAACNDTKTYGTFNLDADGWYELHVAAWLHDCGKLSTPDSVLDKSTKLHGLKDGIEAINARFAALRQETQVRYLHQIIDNPGRRTELQQQMQDALTVLDVDREFINRSNQGAEFLSEEDRARIVQIGKHEWTDAHGEIVPILSAEEIYNLSIERGTLNQEERQIINNHITVTIDMLESLQFPKKLRRVPEYAGGHHEKMDGTGFPKGLKRDEMSIPARMMAIADIFEALTAKDRPYKAPMKISQALSIMQKMRDAEHIDADLYHLFLNARVWEQYALKVLSPEQLDVSSIDTFL